MISESGKTIEDTMLLEKYSQTIGKIEAMLTELYSALFEEDSPYTDVSIMRAFSRICEKTIGLPDASPVKSCQDYLHVNLKPILESVIETYCDDRGLIDGNT